MIEGIQLKTSKNLNHFDQTPEVKQKYTEEEKIKLQKAAKDFESLLTSMMLKSMTQAMGGFFGSDNESDFGNDYFNTIFENELSSHMTEQKGIGIAEMLYQKLTGERMDKYKGLREVHSLPMQEIKKTDSNNSIKPSNSSLKRLEKYEKIIEEAANHFGVDKNLIKSVILTESAAKENAVSTAKAKGLMQLIDSTASEMGVQNVWDPKQNIFGGTKYLSQMLRQYNGSLELALAGYNAGPGNVQKFNGIPPFEETKNYITKVIGYFNHFNES